MPITITAKYKKDATGQKYTLDVPLTWNGERFVASGAPVQTDLDLLKALRDNIVFVIKDDVTKNKEEVTVKELSKRFGIKKEIILRVDESGIPKSLSPLAKSLGTYMEHMTLYYLFNNLNSSDLSARTQFLDIAQDQWERAQKIRNSTFTKTAFEQLEPSLILLNLNKAALAAAKTYIGKRVSGDKISGEAIGGGSEIADARLIMDDLPRLIELKFTTREDSMVAYWWTKKITQLKADKKSSVWLKEVWDDFHSTKGNHGFLEDNIWIDATRRLLLDIAAENVPIKGANGEISGLNYLRESFPEYGASAEKWFNFFWRKGGEVKESKDTIVIAPFVDEATITYGIIIPEAFISKIISDDQHFKFGYSDGQTAFEYNGTRIAFLKLLNENKTLIDMAKADSDGKRSSKYYLTDSLSYQFKILVSNLYNLFTGSPGLFNGYDEQIMTY